MSFFQVLSRPHFALLWISQVLSALGDYLYQIAIIWIAVKVVGSGAGIVAAAESGSLFLCGILGGIFADRWNRRTIMVGVDTLRAVVVLLLAVLTLTGSLQLWHLIIVAILVGSLGAFFEPALQASLPALAKDGNLLQAVNGLMDVTRRLARALGPSLAGLLVAFLPLPHFFTLDGVSFVVSALAIFALGSRFAWKSAHDQGKQHGRLSLLKEIRAALQLILAHQSFTLALIVHGLTSALWRTAFVIGGALFTAQILKAGIGSYGLMVGAYGIGNILMNVCIGSIIIRRRVLVMFTGKIILGVGFLLMVSTIRLPIVLLGSALAGMGGPMFDIMLLTLIQTKLPADHIGKVSSLRLMMEDAGSFLGLLLAVPLFAVLSIPLGIGLCASLMIAAGAISLVYLHIARPSHPRPVSSQP